MIESGADLLVSSQATCLLLVMSRLFLTDCVWLQEEHGVCHIATALSSEMTAELCAVARKNAATLRTALIDLKGEDMADADVFRFYECSQRCAGRLDFRLGLDAAPFNTDELIYHPMWCVLATSDSFHCSRTAPEI